MSGADESEGRLFSSRLGLCTSKMSSGTGPVAPPRSGPRNVVESRCSVTGQVVESSGLKEADGNIRELSSLVKEQSSSPASFKSGFGFGPGNFNNRSAARAPPAIRAFRGLQSPAAPAGLRGLPGPSVVPPARPLWSAERRGLLPPPLEYPQVAAAPTVSSPGLSRSAGSPLSGPGSPRSPRPEAGLLPKPSCSPPPCRSLATTRAAPLVTSASGSSSPATQLGGASSSNFPSSSSSAGSTTPRTRAASSSISRLPGLRAPFFSTD